MGKRFSIEAIFKGVDRLSRPVDKMDKGLGRFSDNQERRSKRMSQSFNKMQFVAVGAMTAITASMVKATMVGAEFEQSVVNAASRAQVFDRTDERFKTITKDALEFGKATEFTATQVAGAFAEFTSAGFEVGDASASMRTQLDFASAGNLDLAKSVKVSTRMLSIFGKMDLKGADRARELEDMQDFMAKISTQAPITISEISESLIKGAPLMEAAGQKFKTVLRSMALVGKSGIVGTAAGTGVQNVLAKLLSSSTGTGRAANIFRDMGVKLKGPNGKLRDMLDIFKDINIFFKKNPLKDKAGIFANIFDEVGLKSALGLLKGVGNPLTDLDKKMSKYLGTTKAMATFQRSTLSKSFTKLGSAAENLGVKMSDVWNPALKSKIESITKALNDNDFAIARIGGTIGKGIIEDFDMFGIAIATVGLLLLPISGTAVLVASSIMLISRALVKVAANWENLQSLFGGGFNLVSAFSKYNQTDKSNGFMARFFEAGFTEDRVMPGAKNLPNTNRAPAFSKDGLTTTFNTSNQIKAIYDGSNQEKTSEVRDRNRMTASGTLTQDIKATILVKAEKGTDAKIESGSKDANISMDNSGDPGQGF